MDLISSDKDLILEQLEEGLELADDFDLILSVRENVAEFDTVGHLHQWCVVAAQQMVIVLVVVEKCRCAWSSRRSRLFLECALSPGLALLFFVELVWAFDLDFFHDKDVLDSLELKHSQVAELLDRFGSAQFED